MKYFTRNGEHIPLRPRSGPTLTDIRHLMNQDRDRQTYNSLRENHDRKRLVTKSKTEETSKDWKVSLGLLGNKVEFGREKKVTTTKEKQ